MQQKSIKKLFQTAGVYTLTGMISSAIPFLLLPVFTKYLNPEDYGIVATFQILISFLLPFIGLSIRGAISVKYYEKGNQDVPVYITNAIGVVIGLGIFSIILSCFFSESLGNAVSFPNSSWLWSLALIAVFQTISQVALALWQMQMKPIPYGVFQILQTISNISLSLFLVVSLSWGWKGRVLAQIVVECFFGIVASIVLVKNSWIKIKAHKEHVLSILEFGIPLIPHALAGWAIMGIDRLFINKMVSVADSGKYAVGYQIAMILTLLEMAFNNAWVPWLYHNLGLGVESVKLKIVRITYLYELSIFLFAILLALIGPWFITHFLGKEFHGSVQYIMWLAMGKAMYSMYFMSCNYLFYKKKTKLVASATTISAVVHVLAIYFLIKINGTIGAAQAGFISTTVLAIITWFFANRIYPMPWFSLMRKEVVSE